MGADVYLPLSHLPEHELRGHEIRPDCVPCDGVGWVPEKFVDSEGKEFVEHVLCNTCSGTGVQKGAKAP